MPVNRLEQRQRRVVVIKILVDADNLLNNSE